MKRNKKVQAILMAGTLAMSGVMAVMPPTTVLADSSYATGSITIRAGAENGDSKTNSAVTYHGYLIFRANVTDNTESENGKLESNISWANESMKAAVEKVIREDAAEGEKKTYKGTTAQDAAEYISEKLQSENTADSAVTVESGTGKRAEHSTFACKLAEAVAGSEKTKDEVNVPEGRKTEGLAEGYWLFVTDPSSTSDATDRTGTAPVFTVIGGSDVTVTEKTSIPTVTKMVKSDAKGQESYGTKPVDSQMEQEVQYELTGTVADNIGTFDTYKYKFTDTLPAGMTPDTEHLKVYAIGKNGTEESSEKTELKRLAADAGEADHSGYKVSYNAEDNQLVIDFADLKSAAAADENKNVLINADTRIIVDYEAKLDAEKSDQVVYGGTGNENEVSLTYSNNPFADGVGISTEKKVRDYTYQLLLHKIDKTTEVNLSGAKFTIRATGADEGTNGDAKYVQKNGALGDQKYEFTTDADGNIRVRGLDAGIYKVEETFAPEGYNLTDPFTFEIKPEYSEADGSLQKLTNELVATDSVIAGSTDGNTSDTVMKTKTQGNDAADAGSGLVKITVGDTRNVNLPLTGQAGIATGVAAGGLLIVISAVTIAKNRKKEEEEA